MLVVALNQENYPDTDRGKTAHLTTGTHTNYYLQF